MNKFILQLLVVLALAFSALSAQASTSLQDQRDQVADALTVVSTEIDTEIAALNAQLALLDPTSTEASVLRSQIRLLESRKRFVDATILQVPRYSATLLDRVIVRFDLPVSLS